MKICIKLKENFGDNFLIQKHNTYYGKEHDRKDLILEVA
jgi:hypothetical protein